MGDFLETSVTCRCYKEAMPATPETQVGLSLNPTADRVSVPRVIHTECDTSSSATL
ncbi:hypothetical protein SBA2_1200001 [Acidobacteriia bacterium SbA2]|nr:hypothetical protein SBA2_1200001 [Acidobacteriia bacterium SbA2]